MNFISCCRKYPHVAIFEDDFVLQKFVDPANVQPLIQTLMDMHKDWDVIALSSNIATAKVLQVFCFASSCLLACLLATPVSTQVIILKDIQDCMQALAQNIGGANFFQVIFFAFPCLLAMAS